jgi:hypothetical protein
MPPRRSARVAAVDERQSSALSPLPRALALHVFSLLPVDVRARAACVCRGWRVTLDEVSLWTWLNLSPSSGLHVRVTDAVLAGAAAKARGQLAALDVSDCDDVTFDALLAVVHANTGALRELCVGPYLDNGDNTGTLGAENIQPLLVAAPQLTACHAAVSGIASVANARRMLRNEAPFQPLRLCALCVGFEGADEASAVALAPDLAAHASLTSVHLDGAPLHMPAALDAVVDAALARQMSSLRFVHCRISPASVLALARLLGGSALTELFISQRREQMLDAPAAALLGAALRANAALTDLSLKNVNFWRDADAAAALLSALTRHSSLRTLSLALNRVGDMGASAGAPLGALVAANVPALTELDVSSSRLGDAGLGPLCAALPTSTHLRELNVQYNGMSAACARDVLLPAVRTNASLRMLQAASDAAHPGVAEATALVAARGGCGRGRDAA